MQTGYFTTEMNSRSPSGKLILASRSPYRRALLKRLGIPFTVHVSDIDELSLPGEATGHLTRRLALAKAHAVAGVIPGAFVVGSDQLAEIAGISIGKPGSEEKAFTQLMNFSGRSVTFHTSAAVICQAAGYCQSKTIETVVRFRKLTEEEVRRYIALDQPLDCAGAFRSEAGGPMLLRSQRSSDPTAIIGLPLIAVAGMLRKAGFKLP